MTIVSLRAVGDGGSFGITDLYLSVAGVPGGRPCVRTAENGCSSDTNLITGDDTIFIEINLGSVAGEYPLRIQLPDFDIDTTLHLTVLPGAAVRAVVTPGDTALQVGAPGAFAVHSEDALGNRRPAVGVVNVIDPGLPFDAGTQVATGAAIGHYRLVGVDETFSDTIAVSVVPVYTIAGIRLDGATVVRRNLDRSGAEQLTVAPAGSTISDLGWGVAGAPTIVYARTSQTRLLGEHGGPETTLDTWTLIGSVGKIVPSRDSNWIFSQYTWGSYPYVSIGRFHADGTGQAVLSPFGGLPTTKPAPSPGGTMVAFVNGDGAAFIKVYEYGVGLRGWATSGQAPRWSPLGDRIAYVDELGGHIRLLDPTDGASTVLTPDSVSYAPSVVSWSPDGLWLIARRTGGSWDLIRLSDVLTLPLPTEGDLGEIVFRP